MSSTFNAKNFFDEPVYPRVTLGKHTMKIKSFSNPVETKKANGDVNYYITITGELETGRPYSFNVFVTGWNIEFQNPVQSILDPENEVQWSSKREFLQAVLAHDPFDVWLVEEKYASAGEIKKQIKVRFREPIVSNNAPSVVSVSTRTVNSNTNVIVDEDIPF